MHTCTTRARWVCKARAYPMWRQHLFLQLGTNMNFPMCAYNCDLNIFCYLCGQPPHLGIEKRTSLKNISPNNALDEIRAKSQLWTLDLNIHGSFPKICIALDEKKNSSSLLMKTRVIKMAIFGSPIFIKPQFYLAKRFFKEHDIHHQ